MNEKCMFQQEKVFGRHQGFALENKYRSHGFQWQQLGSQGMRSEDTVEMCPHLTCLHTRNAGGVKHPLPLSRTQRNLVCHQVYLTQRPKQQLGKTVERRHWTWVCNTESSCIRLCTVKLHTKDFKNVHTTCFNTSDRVAFEGSVSKSNLLEVPAFGPKEYKTFRWADVHWMDGGICETCFKPSINLLYPSVQLIRQTQLLIMVYL